MKKKLEDVSKVEVELPTEKDTLQTKQVGMFKQSSDFDSLDQLNPFVGMASNPCGGRSTGRKD